MASTALADGTYVMINGANTKLALDCVGATSYDGANVSLHESNETDAQLVRVWTRQDGTRQLCFAGSGKCVDVVGGTVAQGQNVQQYTANDTAAQQWTVSPVDGTTITVGAAAYQAYKVYYSATDKASTRYLLEVDGIGTPSSGANLCIAADEGTSADQTWAFLPRSHVPDGTYCIRSALDTNLVLDVDGSSHGGGARVMISGWHVGSGVDHGNNQVVYVQTDAKTGQSKIKFTHSWMVMEIAQTKNEAHRDQDVVQSADEGTSTDQFWVIVPNGTARLNGTIMPTYSLHNVASEGTTQCLDVTGGSTTPGTRIRLWPENNSRAQSFVFEPCAFTDTGIRAPSLLGIAPKGSVEPRSLQEVARGSVPAWWRQAWKGTASAWQARYRSRARSASTGSWGSWGKWLSCEDASEANGGWGYCNRATDCTKDGSRTWSSRIWTYELGSSYDAAQVEVEARALDVGGHIARTSAGVSQVSTIVCVPKATITQALVDFEGLHLTWSIDFLPAGIWDVRLGSVMTSGSEWLAAPVELAGASGTTCVPWTGLTGVPAAGAALVCTCTLASSLLSSTSTSQVACAHAASETLAASATFVASDRLTDVCETARHALDGVYVARGGRALAACPMVSETSTTRTWDVVAPLVSPRALVVAHEEAGPWCATMVDLPEHGLQAHVWTWTDARGRMRCAALFVGHDHVPSGTDSRSASVTEYETVGAELPVMRAGSATKHDVSVTGAILPASDVAGTRWEGLAAWSTVGAIEELLRQRRATYRSPDGRMCDVYVSGYDMPRESDRYVEVTVTQAEEAR